MIMPVQDGLETIRILHRDYPELPILAMSGGGRMNDLSLLLNAVVEGAAMTLIKPFTVGKLMDAVDHCFSGTLTPEV
jgi:CheY-like chemotaxis protein